MQRQIQTIHPDYRECILDIDIFGRVVSTPQQSLEEMTQALFEEFKLRRPMPTLEARRYELSRLVSPDYQINYRGEPELQDNEALIDLASGESSMPPLDFEDLSALIPEVQESFTYEEGVTDDIRRQIIEKFDLSTLEEFKPGVAETEKVVGSVQEDKSTYLSDEEIDNLGKEQEETPEELPAWMAYANYGGSSVPEPEVDTDYAVVEEEGSDMSEVLENSGLGYEDDSDEEPAVQEESQGVENQSSGYEDDSDEEKSDEEDGGYFESDESDEEESEDEDDGYFENDDSDEEEEAEDDGYLESDEEEQAEEDDGYFESDEEEESDEGEQVDEDDGYFESGEGGEDYSESDESVEDDLLAGYDSDEEDGIVDFDTDEYVEDAKAEEESSDEEQVEFDEDDGELLESDEDGDELLESDEDDGELLESDEGDEGLLESDEDSDDYLGYDDDDSGELLESDEEDSDELLESDEDSDELLESDEDTDGDEMALYDADEGESDDGDELLESDESDDMSAYDVGEEQDENLPDFTSDDDDFEFAPVVSPPPAQVRRPEPAMQTSQSVVDKSAEPTEIRAFLRKHPRSDIKFVLQYFTKKQIDDAIKLGRINKKGNILRC